MDKWKEKLRNLFSSLTRHMQKAGAAYQKKASWSNLATMIIGVFTLETFRSIGAAMAEYQDKKAVYDLSVFFTGVIIMIALWEVFCLMSGIHAGKIGSSFCGLIRKAWLYIKGRSPKTKWKMLAAAAAIAILIPLAWKLFYHDKCVTEYYASVVEIYGIPNGMGDPLSQEELNSRAGYWRIDDYPNQRRVELTYIGAHQQMEILQQYSSIYDMQLFPTPARIEYTYKTNPDRFRSYGQNSFMIAKENRYREPLTVSYYGSNGKLLLEMEKDDDDIFTIEYYSSEDIPQLLNSTLLRIPDGQTAGNGLVSRQIETVYNSDGFPATRRLNQDTNNLYGVNGERYTYDSRQRLASLCYLDGDGEPVCNKNGIMLITFKYNTAGTLRSIRYYSDENGTEKTEGFYGVFCESFNYDSSDNLIERRQLDRTENWAYDENGVYRYEYIYAGNVLQEEFYWGINEFPAWNKCSGSHSISFESGLENGRKVLSVSFDISNSPVKPVDSLAVSAIPLREGTTARDWSVRGGTSDWQRNDPGGLSGRMDDTDSGMNGSDSGINGSDNSMNGSDNSMNGSDSSMSESVSGAPVRRQYASIQYVFGNKTLEMRYCDANGQLVLNNQGYAVKKIEYDNKMRIILESYANVNEEPCYIQGGYAAVRKIYEDEDKNRVSRLEYLDIQGNVTFNTEVGYACVEYEYDPQDRGEKITQAFYGTRNDPCCISDKGYAITENLYNENGFLIQSLYKNTEGAVTCRRDYMVAEILYEYADDGNLIRERYKDVEGQPVNRADTGYAVVYQEFEDGRLVRKCYEGYEDQTLCAVPDRTTGVAAISYRYENGEKREENYSDADGNPALRRDIGCASIQYEYDNNGQLLAEYYYGTDAELVLRTDTGCAIIRFGYDKEGRRNSWRYYGTDEEPVVNTEYHCAGMDYDYDEKGYRSAIRYIGLDGESLMNRDDYGIAVIYQEYDDFGNLLGESYCDQEGSPSIRKDRGYASYENTYKGGYITKVRYLDTNGDPILCKDGGYAAVLYEYDDLGQYISCRFLGEDGQPVISSKYHCAQIDRHHDERGYIVRLSYKGLKGETINRSDYGISDIYRTYDVSGNLVAESYYDADGLPAVRKEYGYAGFRNIYEDGYKVESQYYDTSGGLILRKDKGYAIIRFEYDEYGQKLSEYYYGVQGEPVIHTTLYCAGLEYEYDAMGNQIEIRYMGLEGESINRRDYGVARTNNEYDISGNLICRQYFDTEGRPAVRREYGYASYEGIYENGLLLESRYFDPYGNPVLRTDTGYAVIRTEYNQRGQKVAEYYYDTLGNPVISTKYYCAGKKYTYDDRGNQNSVCYLGLDGEPLNRDDLGCAIVRKTYDDTGNLTGESYYDTENRPAIRKEYGYAAYSTSYINGQNDESRYFDTDGSLVLRKDDGYAIVKSNYDEYGRVMSRFYFGTNEEPVINTKFSCAGFLYAYDDKSYQTEIKYTDLNGEVANRSDCGAAMTHREYDRFGNLVGASYYDADNNPTVWKEYGYASYLSTYENGKCTETRYFDLNGNLILRKDTGYAILRMDYDDFGQKTSESYYGTDEQPIIHTEYGCAGIGYAYDDKGNYIEKYYWGLDGGLIDIKNFGMAKVCMEYDLQGRLTGESYFDAAGQPVARKDGGYASYKNIYENGRLTEVLYFNADNRPVLHRNTGRARIMYQYDELGRSRSVLSYGTSGEPVISTKYNCASTEYTYDDRGNEIKVQYMGLDGSLMNRYDTGIAQLERQYDRYGNLIVESCYDTEGNLALRERGYAVCQTTYVNGRETEIRYLDTSGNLIIRESTGYAMVRYEYNEYGQKVMEQYYGTDGEPVISTVHHCAGFRYEYDDRGNQTTTWYLGTDGQAAAREDSGADLEYWVYDEYNSLKWDAYYTYSDGEYDLVVPEGLDYAGMEYAYDENENWISRRYFDAEEKSVICSETGYAVYERRYNNIEQLIAEIYYDENGNYINSVNGYAMIEYIYDASGNTVDWKYYDQTEVEKRLESM